VFRYKSRVARENQSTKNSPYFKIVSALGQALQHSALGPLSHTQASEARLSTLQGGELAENPLKFKTENYGVPHNRSLLTLPARLEEDDFAYERAPGSQLSIPSIF
jgi:hypothetical protein